MIQNLERICIAFYQQKGQDAYMMFQQMLPQILNHLESKGKNQGIMILKQILDEVEKQDWVMVADYINFELIPILQES